MPLHARRKRLAEIADRETAGESFWTEEFSDRFRERLVQWLTTKVSGGVVTKARDLILFDEGVPTLIPAVSFPNPVNEFVYYVRKAPSEMLPTVVEALHVAIGEIYPTSRDYTHLQEFDAIVNELLREDRISWELIDGQVVPQDSKVLHTAVVAPVLSLLHGGEEWRATESAFRDALSEISLNKGPNAITDAGTALQEALDVLGCEGGTLGDKIKSARSNGIIAAHDTPLLNSLDRALQWVSADRSQSGDGHWTTEADIDDAWLIVHVVGALILRLSKRRARPSTSPASDAS